MALLKKLIVAFFISFAMIAAAPSAFAKPEGSVMATLPEVVALAEETLAAMKSGEDKDTVLALLKKTKQASKEVVISGPADLPRTRANAKIKKSRRAFRKGDIEKAIKLAEEGLAYYKQSASIHFK